MKDIVKDLADRMALLRVRHDVVFVQVGHPANPEYLSLAEALYEGLLAGDPVAVARARAVVDPADLDRKDFWATSLGRLMFAAGAFGSGMIGRGFAAGILGCSRQWVHELVTSGRLTRSPGSAVLVSADDVREVLKTRIDSLVK